MARVSGDIERSNDIVATRIFKRSKTFVSNKVWPILDPIVKHHLDPTIKEHNFSDLELKILETIEDESSIRTDHLRKTLNLGGKENNSKFHRSLTHLESYALIVGVEDPHPERHLHANIWQTWDTRTKGGSRPASRSYSDALARLLGKTIDACVIVREDQIPGWFEWSSDMQVAKDQALQDGSVLKSGPYLVSPKVSDVNN